MDKAKLNLFFDQACVISLSILLFFIPVSSAFIEVMLGVSIVFFLGRLLTAHNLLNQLLKKEKIVLCFFVALAFSLVNSGGFIAIGLQALFFKWGEYIVLYLMVTQTFTSATRIKYALASFSCGVVLVIVDCFSQLYLNSEFIRHRHMILHTNNILAVTGPFKHNNDFSAYLVCALIIMLYWMFTQGPKVIKCMAGITFMSGIYILNCAYSRGGWITFICAMMFLAFFMKKFWFLGFSLGLTIILGFKINLLKFLVFKDSGRFELWDICWKMIREHPVLGNGIGTYMAWFRHYSPTGGISYAHNCFMQLWAEAGLISVVIFAFFIIKKLSKGILGFKECKNPVNLILPCAAIAFVCHSCVDTFLFSYQLAAMFWALMGLMNSLPNGFCPVVSGTDPDTFLKV